MVPNEMVLIKYLVTLPYSSVLVVVHTLVHVAITYLMMKKQTKLYCNHKQVLRDKIWQLIDITREVQM